MANPPNTFQRVPMTRKEPEAKPMEPAVASAIETIAQLTMADVPKLPEPLFLERIFPILIDTSGKANVENWLLVAGSLNRPIDVVDGAGNVLFRVPALHRSLPTKSTRDRRLPLGEIAAQFKLRNERSPMEAERFAKNQYDANVPRPSLDRTTIDQLNIIFARYNHPLIKIGPQKEETVKVPEENLGLSGELDGF